jgi:Tat protein secretion system quality control protein TatD with DNase activity
MSQPSLPSVSVLSRIVDVHCHPTDSPTPDEEMNKLKIKVCAMATRADDQIKVRQLAEQWPDKVIPCFGWHPWFSHLVTLKDDPSLDKQEHYRALLLPPSPNEQDEEAFMQLMPSLPDPRPLSSLISEIRSNLEAFPGALLGEVGIDRSFRVPFQPYGSPPPRTLTPFTVPIEHQLAILEAQLELAMELRRNVSVHSVKSHQATLDLLDRMRKKYGASWLRINLCLHSCSLSAQTWEEVQKQHPNVYASQSALINSRSPNHEKLIRICNPTRILAESDFHDIRESTELTWEIVRIIGQVKGWPIEEDVSDDWDTKPESEWGVVRRLEANWKAFLAGGDDNVLNPNRKNRRTRQMNNFPHAEEDWDDDEDSEPEVIMPK